MSSTRPEIEGRDNFFYRDYYEKIIIAFIAIMGIAILISGVVLFQVFHKPLPRFTAVSTDGQRLALNAYDEPNLLSTTILTWASKAAVAAYTFDFVNYNNQMQLARPYFTPSGWDAYQSAVESVIQRITQNQLFVNGVVSGAPVISNQGDLPGSGYSWRVQIPFLVTYQSAESTKSRTYMVTLMIVRVPTTVNPDAIGIDKFSML